MLTAEDHAALHKQYLLLAGETRTLAHRTDFAEMVSMSMALLEISNIHLQASAELERKERTMRLRNLSIFIAVMVALLLGVLAVMAQDTPSAATDVPTLVSTISVTAMPTLPAPTPEPVKSPVDVVPVDQAAHQLLVALMAIIGTVFSAPLTLLIVSWLKMIPILNNISARMLQLTVAVILVVATWLTNFFGLSAQFTSFLNAFQVAGPVVLQFVLTLIGSHAAYNYAAPRELPIIGYQRPVQTSAYRSPGVKGQGLVEYALILVLVAVVVVVILALLGPAIGNIFSNIVANLNSGGQPVPQ